MSPSAQQLNSQLQLSGAHWPNGKGAAIYVQRAARFPAALAHKSAATSHIILSRDSEALPFLLPNQRMLPDGTSNSCEACTNDSMRDLVPCDDDHLCSIASSSNHEQIMSSRQRQ